MLGWYIPKSDVYYDQNKGLIKTRNSFCTVKHSFFSSALEHIANMRERKKRNAHSGEISSLSQPVYVCVCVLKAVNPLKREKKTYLNAVKINIICEFVWTEKSLPYVSVCFFFCIVDIAFLKIPGLRFVVLIRWSTEFDSKRRSQTQKYKTFCNGKTPVCHFGSNARNMLCVRIMYII